MNTDKNGSNIVAAVSIEDVKSVNVEGIDVFVQDYGNEMTMVHVGLGITSFISFGAAIGPLIMDGTLATVAGCLAWCLATATYPIHGAWSEMRRVFGKHFLYVWAELRAVKEFNGRLEALKKYAAQKGVEQPSQHVVAKMSAERDALQTRVNAVVELLERNRRDWSLAKLEKAVEKAPATEYNTTQDISDIVYVAEEHMRVSEETATGEVTDTLAEEFEEIEREEAEQAAKQAEQRPRTRV